MEISFKVSVVLLVVFHFGLVHSDEFQCIKCSSADKEDCIANPEAITETDKCSTTCFTDDSDSKIVRGCSSEQQCKEETPNCKLCSGDKCNNENKLNCYDCTSENNNKKCAVFDTTITSKSCGKDLKSCVMRIDDKMNTIRGCASSDIENNCTGDTCKFCKGINCNNDPLFPTDRIKCYQCDVGTDNCDDLKNLNEDVCNLYVKNDQCYAYSPTNTTGKMKRGCASDSDFKNCSDLKDRCHTCVGNKCNNVLFETDAKLKCIQCTPSTDNNCQVADPSKATPCSKKVQYFATEQCYSTVLNNNPISVQRGCNLDNEKSVDCNQNGSHCCNTDACNVDIVWSCIRCRSDYNDGYKCKKEASELKGSSCINSIIDDKSKLCYSRRVDSRIFRGCYADLDEDAKNKCTDPKNDSCKICDKESCNTDEIKGGASHLTIYFGLTLFNLLLLLFVK